MTEPFVAAVFSIYLYIFALCKLFLCFSTKDVLLSLLSLIISVLCLFAKAPFVGSQTVVQVALVVHGFGKI